MASKRKVDFAESDDLVVQGDDESRRFKGKHSLDSDEEDDDTGKYDVLPEDEIEGVEHSTKSYLLYGKKKKKTPVIGLRSQW